MGFSWIWSWILGTEAPKAKVNLYMVWTGWNDSVSRSLLGLALDRRLQLRNGLRLRIPWPCWSASGDCRVDARSGTLCVASHTGLTPVAEAASSNSKRARPSRAKSLGSHVSACGKRPHFRLPCLAVSSDLDSVLQLPT